MCNCADCGVDCSDKTALIISYNCTVGDSIQMPVVLSFSAITASS
jgi:hypothetical protein